MQKYIILIIVIFALSSCNTVNTEKQIEIWKAEVTETEKDFAELALTEGVANAFMAYADEDAVMNRNNILIKGKAEIEVYFETHDYSKVELNWTPDIVNVSQSGDLAYTYGKYTFSNTDSTGQKQESTGIFHTVWKRQPDGKWKFVWD